MAIDWFQTRFLTETVNQILPPRAFFLNKFFPNEVVSGSEHIEYDIIKGKRRLAPLVSPLHEGEEVEKIGFTRKSVRPGYIKAKKTLSTADITKVQAGMNIYQQIQSPAATIEKQMADELIQLQDEVVRREELMAAQALTTGKVQIVGKGLNAEVDFDFALTHLGVVPAILWDQATADPLVDLKDWGRIINTDSGLVATDVVMGVDAATEFLNNAIVQKLLDNRRIELGQISPQLQGMGAILLGVIRTSGVAVNLWEYDAKYLDDVGAEQFYLPEKGVIVASDQAKTMRYYGAIKDLKFAEPFPLRWFAKSWEREDPSVRIIMLQSAPLPVIKQADGFLYAEVL